jgi:hypothetical protein
MRDRRGGYISGDDSVAKVLRAAGFAAQSAYLDAAQHGQTGATCTSKAVEAAFECALGNGLIEITDPQTWPKWWSVDPPYDPEVARLTDVKYPSNTGPAQTGANPDSEASQIKEHVARILHDAATGSIVPDPADPIPYGRMAQQVYDEVVAPLVDALCAVRDLCDTAAPSLSMGPADCTGSCSHGPCDCSGIRQPLAWGLDPDRVRQAIAQALGVPREADHD